MLSYDVENIVSQLARKENFYGQEEKIIEAIEFVFQKDCFNDMSENNAVELKNIIQRCTNNNVANTHMAYAIGSLMKIKASVLIEIVRMKKISSEIKLESKGYFNGVRAQAKDTFYEKAVNNPVNYLKPKLELDNVSCQEFFMDYYDDNSEIIEFKKSVKQRYVDGLREDFKKRGRKFARANETDKKKYAFENIKLKQSDLGEFYDNFKKSL